MLWRPWRWFLLVTWTRLDDWRLDDGVLWLGGWLGYLTFDLVYILSWISRGLSTCLGLELIMTDDAARWDDDEIDGYVVVVIVPYFVLLASWVLHTLRVGFLKPLLVGSKRTLAGSSIRVGSLVFSWSWKIWEDWSLPHRHKHIVSDGFYQYIIEFSIHIWCLSYMWFIYCYDALMINKCCL